MDDIINPAMWSGALGDDNPYVLTTDRLIQREEQRMKAYSMFLNSLGDAKAMEVSEIYPIWLSGLMYAANDIVRYGQNSVGDSQLYRCLQAHTAQDEWSPDKTPALWSAIGISPSGYPEWSQPTGAADAYNKGDIVSYNGTLFRSLIDGNVWAPDVYPAGWEEVEEDTEGIGWFLVPNG